jgi:Oxidoreductase family, NAD-binding Rossmann fold
MTIPLRIGVAGLGRAFTLMLPTFLLDRRVQLVAACDPVDSARARFERDFRAPAYETVEALCRDDKVQVVDIATPHQLHSAHVRIAAAAGKHMLRLLAQSPVQIVQAHTGAWDPVRATEGAYSALLGFADGSVGCATYSGYGHFDSDIFMDNISEIGLAKNSNDYGGGDYQDLPSLPKPEAYQHFGVIVVSCDHADLRPTAQGIAIDSDEDQTFIPLPAPDFPRKEVIDELCDAVVYGGAPVHCGMWAPATTEVCSAILESAKTQSAQRMHYQLTPTEFA